jgi:S1-C subfamily serine protease
MKAIVLIGLLFVPAANHAQQPSTTQDPYGGVPAFAPARPRQPQSPPVRKDIPAIAKAANGAIVTIIMAANDKPITQGSGFLVSPDGVIVTNYHVIETGSVATVKFPDGTVLPVDGVSAADKNRDLAVIKIHGKTFRTLVLGNSDQIQVGEEVVAIGNPLSLESTVSNGIVSGVRTSKEQGGKFLQTTAPISPGSSGGPLFNMYGEVVGVNTMYLEGGENLNFAIPINDAKLLLNQSARLQSLPNEVEPPKESPKVPPVLPSVGQSLDSPAYRQYQELLKAGDLTMRTGIYACFYDSKERTTKFFVISANLSSKHAMHASVNDFTDGVLGDSPSLFGGDVKPFSSRQAIFADLPTGYDYKNSVDKSHETDVFKWVSGDITIEHGFGKLMPGQVRFGSRFKLQQSTGRFVEDIVFNTGIEPEGSTIHETGQCIRIPNIIKTPEEQYELVDKQVAPTNTPSTKVIATRGTTLDQLWEAMKYCFQNPSDNIQLSDGDVSSCREVNATREEQETKCNTGPEDKTSECGVFLLRNKSLRNASEDERWYSNLFGGEFQITAEKGQIRIITIRPPSDGILRAYHISAANFSHDIILDGRAAEQCAKG